MVVRKKSDNSVVTSPSWITRNDDQLTPSLLINTSNAAYEGIYLIEVSSKLFNESAFSPSFLFELYMHPSPCVHTVINPNGTIKVSDMNYEIHPANVPTTTEFNAYSASPASCIIQYKFTFDIANSTALSLLTKEATATDLGIASALVLT
jgi:hypothetical protein